MGLALIDELFFIAKDLIQHLLCVDPTVRFTIDEFLVHPWCTALPGPPPPPTPFSAVPLDSPLLAAARGGNVDGRSPGLATLKDAFDIAYAVHRMGEEGGHRRKDNGRGTAGAQGFLSQLNEDEEDWDDDDEEEENMRGRVNVMQKQPQAQDKGPTREWDVVSGKVVARVPAHKPGKTATRQGQGRKVKDFELDLHGSTLLGRRNRQKAGSPLGVPLTNAIGGMRVVDV